MIDISHMVGLPSRFFDGIAEGAIAFGMLAVVIIVGSIEWIEMLRGRKK